MKSKIVLVVLAILFMIALVGCSAQVTDGDEQITPSVMTLKGPTGVSMVKMIDDDMEIGAYDFRIVGSPDEIVAAIGNGDADIAAIPTNLAAKLYAKTEGKILMLAVNTYGSLYVLENGEDIQDIEDLAGKTIYATGQGANPQYILEYLLNAAELIPGEDVEISYKSEHAELATLFVSGEVDIAMLPEPFVSTVLSKNDQLRIALDFNDEWTANNGTNLTMGCVVASREFVEANPQAVADFLDALEQSVAYSLADASVTAELCAKHGIIENAAIAEAAIPNMGLTMLSGEDMEVEVSRYLAMLFEADPASIGGAMPEQEFYYHK